MTQPVTVGGVGKVSVSVLIPLRHGESDPDRLYALGLVLGYYRDNFPDWQLIIRTSEPFARGRALNAAAGMARGSVLVFQDADSLVPPRQLEDAVRLAQGGLLAWAFTIYCRLSRASTRSVHSWEDLDDVEPEQVAPMPSLGVAAIRGDVFQRVGGYDARFVEWGYEDSAFAVACERAGVEGTRVEGPLWHLWHPPAPGSDLSTEKSEDAERNRLLYEREYANG